MTDSRRMDYLENNLLPYLWVGFKTLRDFCDNGIREYSMGRRSWRSKCYGAKVAGRLKSI